MQIKLTLGLGALAALCVPALHADVLQQFNVSGSINTFASTDPCASTPNGCVIGSFGGTLTVDTTAGNIVSSNLSAIDEGTSYTFGQATSQGVSPVEACDHVSGGCFYDTYQAFYSSANGAASLDLYLDTAATIDGSLKGYTGGVVCNLAYGCGSDVQVLYTMFSTPESPYFEAVAGPNSQTTPGPIVATPEPSSLALLGTGVLGLAGTVRRKLRRA